MGGKRKVVDARKDREGDISHVRLEGNRNFTPVKSAIEIAKRGGLENAHAVKQKGGGEHLRTNPNRKAGDNLDEMAQD